MGAASRPLRARLQPLLVFPDQRTEHGSGESRNQRYHFSTQDLPSSSRLQTHPTGWWTLTISGTG